MRENLPIEVKFSRWVVGDADPYIADSDQSCRAGGIAPADRVI